jgi:pyruvate dehydrogenase E2 component (dihydrolipoamide acetyltransferase)
VPIDVTMPKLSDTMEEGKILRWMKHVGDAVRIGEILAEVETDKANMELEAYDEGELVEVRVAENESAPVGAVIAVLKAPDEQPGAPAPAAGKDLADDKGPAAPPHTPASPPPARRPAMVRRQEPAREARRAPERSPVKASPLARRVAQEHDLDLQAIRGTGPGGRIVERDVTAALVRPGPAAPVEPAPPPGAGRVDLSRIRRTTAKRMSEAKREVPHFYASAEVGMDEAARLRDALRALGDDYAGLTYTHLVLKAVGLALRRVPELNASYDGDAMILHEAVNVGIATATDEGLLVPVVRACDAEPLAGIVRRARALVERARAGRFGADDLVGGTFTVSNLGMFPVSAFAAVINAPQAAILAVSTIREVPVVRGGQVVPGRLMTVTLSCDHRIVDGVLAGRFLAELKALLENPIALLV